MVGYLYSNQSPFLSIVLRVSRGVLVHVCVCLRLLTSRSLRTWSCRRFDMYCADLLDVMMEDDHRVMIVNYIFFRHRYVYHSLMSQ